jgi:hypothetical protein
MDKGMSYEGNNVGLTMGHGDTGRVIGVFDVWTTRGGLPVAGLENGLGTKLYRTKANNTMTTAMLNLLANVMWKIAANASGPAGGLWTTGPYIGLALSAQVLTAATTLATAATFEASGNGYTARALPTWSLGTTGQGNASQVSWTASVGNLGGAALGQLFTTPAASGAGVAPNVILQTFATLNGGPFTIAVGNTFNVTYSHTFS